jgi:hypothetical protein
VISVGRVVHRRRLRCLALLTAATPHGGATPPDTFTAIVEVAHDPAHHIVELFAVSGLPPMPYAPARARSAAESSRSGSTRKTWSS